SATGVGAGTSAVAADCCCWRFDLAAAALRWRSLFSSSSRYTAHNRTKSTLQYGKVDSNARYLNIKQASGGDLRLRFPASSSAWRWRVRLSLWLLGLIARWSLLLLLSMSGTGS